MNAPHELQELLAECAAAEDSRVPRSDIEEPRSKCRPRRRPNPPPGFPVLWTEEQLAEGLGKSVSLVRKERARGALKCVHVGKAPMFTERQVNEYLARRTR
jgi:hypothetical protein